jgi:hypothetical protein
MKKKVESLRQIMATIFISINDSQRKKGTGLMFKYKNEPYQSQEGEVEGEGWIFSIILEEIGYKERTIQAFPFTKVNGVDRYQMEYNVLMSALIIFTENTFLQWDELGKILNADREMQKVAIETLKSDD